MAPIKLADVAQRQKTETETERYLYALEKPEEAAAFAILS